MPRHRRRVIERWAPQPLCGWDGSWAPLTKVGAECQPWALGRNAVGIPKQTRRCPDMPQMGMPGTCHSFRKPSLKTRSQNFFPAESRRDAVHSPLVVRIERRSAREFSLSQLPIRRLNRPFETRRVSMPNPTLKVLGYCQMSLRDRHPGGAYVFSRGRPTNNPNGIVAQGPRLARQRLPWVNRPDPITTATRLRRVPKQPLRASLSGQPFPSNLLALCHNPCPQFTCI